MRFSLFLYTLLLFIPLQGDPWGKDADLSFSTPPPPPKRHHGPLEAFAEMAIRFHKSTISKADGPRSHYLPSSSMYTRDAIRKYGFFNGFLLGCDRLMRENEDPWIYQTIEGPYGTLKLDPVR